MILFFMFAMVFILCAVLCVIGAVVWKIFHAICSFHIIPIILGLILAGLCTYPLKAMAVIVFFLILGFLENSMEKQARARKL